MTEPAFPRNRPTPPTPIDPLWLIRHAQTLSGMPPSLRGQWTGTRSTSFSACCLRLPIRAGLSQRPTTACTTRSSWRQRGCRWVMAPRMRNSSRSGVIGIGICESLPRGSSGPRERRLSGSDRHLRLGGTSRFRQLPGQPMCSTSDGSTLITITSHPSTDARPPADRCRRKRLRGAHVACLRPEPGWSRVPQPDPRASRIACLARRPRP